MGPNELSEKNIRHLELEFSYNKSPDAETRSALSGLTGLSTGDISKWFVTRLGNDASSNNESSATPSNSRGSEEIEPEIFLKATVTDQAEKSDNGNESSLPGYMILEADGLSPIRKTNRRRRHYNYEERQIVAQVRKIGACAECRSRKVACKHVYDAVTRERSTFSTKSADGSDILLVHPSVALSDYQAPKTSGLPTTDSWEFPLWQTPKLLDLEKPEVEMPEVEIISADPEPQTQPISNLKNSDLTLDTVQDGRLDGCSKCGFKPIGDPRWHKSNLARHIRIQHNDKLIQLHCKFQGCDRVYRRSDNLRAHIKRVHDSEDKSRDRVKETQTT